MCQYTLTCFNSRFTLNERLDMRQKNGDKSSLTIHSRSCFPVHFESVVSIGERFSLLLSSFSACCTIFDLIKVVRRHFTVTTVCWWSWSLLTFLLVPRSLALFLSSSCLFVEYLAPHPIFYLFARSFLLFMLVSSSTLPSHCFEGSFFNFLVLCSYSPPSFSPIPSVGSFNRTCRHAMNVVPSAPILVRVRTSRIHKYKLTFFVVLVVSFILFSRTHIKFHRSASRRKHARTERRTDKCVHVKKNEPLVFKVNMFSLMIESRWDNRVEWSRLILDTLMTTTRTWWQCFKG